MKILIVTPRYFPENFRITEIAETLSSRGHSITILTTLPNDGSGKVLKEYKKGQHNDEMINGVHVLRVKCCNRGETFFQRFFYYYSFPNNASRIIKKLDRDFNVVLYNGLTPIIAGFPAIKYKKLFHAKTLMYCMDLWPESLLAGGIKKNGLIYNYYKKISSEIYGSFDRILVSTKEHIGYIKSLKNCSDIDIQYLPQCADSFFEVTNKQIDSKENIDILFAGNIGVAQVVDVIIRAANLLKDDPKYKFHIVGDGKCLKEITDLKKSLNLSNVNIYGRRPLSEMSTFYNMCDIFISTLADSSYANLTIPGKIQSYLAFGKTLIVSGNGSMFNLIKDNDIGLAVKAEDPEALATAIKSLDKSKMEYFGKKAKDFYDANFTKERFITELEKHLISL